MSQKNPGPSSAGIPTKLQQYISALEKYPPLSVEEETELVKRIKLGDENARNKLIEANLRFVVSQAKKYQNERTPLFELITEGNYGLIQAAQSFDGSMGNRFITYATHWIKKYFLKALSETESVIHIPDRQVWLIRKIKREQSRLLQANGEQPSMSELAKSLNMEEADVTFLLNISSRSTSLDGTDSNDEEEENKPTFLDTYHDEEAPETDQLLISKSDKSNIIKSLEALPEREREVISLFYGIGIKKRLTTKEIASKFNISTTRVYQLKKTAIYRLEIAGFDKGLLADLLK